MENIHKAFPGVQALEKVTFEVARPEIHALVGENGAGKTTLMKILTGALHQDEGQITIQDRPVTINTPSDAQRLGISMIHQELSLLPYLTVGQNIYLGREPRGRLPGVIDWRALYQQAQAWLDRLNVDVDARAQVKALSIAQQQMVEVAKALSLDADLIVMDEPTSALTERETRVLFDVMHSLKEEGVSLIFISHRLEEVLEIADRVTILRDGQWIDTQPIVNVDEEAIVRMMVGRELGELYPKAKAEQREVILEATNLSDGEKLHDIDLTLHRGEIVGLAGLVGAGRTALAEAIFGIRSLTSGEVTLDGQVVKIKSPGEAIRRGIGLVPKDRKQQGLFMHMAVRENIVISVMDQITRWGFVNRSRANNLAHKFVRQLEIRTPHLSQRVRNLSGGNQQKVIIARWLTLKPHILIMDEPTRGIDVGAKAEIHALMSQLAQEGVGILMISSELPEILGISDRILVMREGHVVGAFAREEATQDAIMYAATGGKVNHYAR